MTRCCGEMARDPLVIKETRVDAVFGLVDLMDSALEAAPLLDVPLLLMYGAHDEVVPRQPLAEFVAHLPTEPRYPRRFAYYPAGYHLLLRDLGGGIVANGCRELDFRSARAVAVQRRCRRRGISLAARAGERAPAASRESGASPISAAGESGDEPARVSRRATRAEDASRNCAAAALAPALARR